MAKKGGSAARAANATQASSPAHNDKNLEAQAILQKMMHAQNCSSKNDDNTDIRLF